MNKRGSIIGQITEELGELGKKVVTETVQAPVDIAGQLFEKGTAAKGQSTQQTPGSEAVSKGEKTPLDQIEETKAEKDKRAIARAALEYLASKKKSPEPSVYEQKIKEEGEKKETAKKQAAAAAWQQLPNTGAAPTRGDLRNITKKQAGTETSRNVRQD